MILIIYGWWQLAWARRKEQKEGECKGQDQRRDGLHLWNDGTSLLHLGTRRASQVSVAASVTGFPLTAFLPGPVCRGKSTVACWCDCEVGISCP